jgi:CheY-like chemotaxis protein
MSQGKFRNRILIADDDADDRMIMQYAMSDHFVSDSILFKEDGHLVMDHLHQLEQHSLPELILLDINMPKVSGMEALAILKDNDRFRHIPVIMFTTSSSPEEIKRAYELGASGFILKPNKLQDFVNILKTIGEYWFGVVKLVQ